MTSPASDSRGATDRVRYNPSEMMDLGPRSGISLAAQAVRRGAQGNFVLDQSGCQR